LLYASTIAGAGLCFKSSVASRCLFEFSSHFFDFVTPSTVRPIGGKLDQVQSRKTIPPIQQPILQSAEDHFIDGRQVGALGDPETSHVEMYISFSLRSRQIIFAARVKAGERGANMIDVDDLLVGWVLEDQGMLEKGLFPTVREGTFHFVNQDLLHIPFFSPQIANNLLAKIEGILPRSQSVGLSTDIPLSSALIHAFNSAEEIQTRFQHSQIEPLHVLAALLAEESSQGVKLLHDSEITQEKVLLKLGSATEN